ncbi:hypothetical protein SODALDRAFT_347939 [Sodiomyces alkalinus F11]|uniref:Histone chaperone domain-containing protein n=1 Tax=Sodiomyces alkalinus (strain CBS 110278 / VKM F-3762 / F11) TaxID=1314773 RepID=A0A3N2Q8N4_SODAK|nr:hypothetical protein SODALDRAFT_347939 [Sodiomyces alkalinus F11]ROT43141.1 hypothetical protein SODALDRAFT_347939 [Sodiomyces alkalinus F11]
MSKNAWQQSDEDPGAPLPSGAPEGQVQDDSYATGANESVPVQSDDAKVEEPIKTELADTDQQLEQDEREAVDKSNIIQEGLRHAKPRGTYKEPDNQDLME